MKVGDLIYHKPSKVLGVITFAYQCVGYDDMVEVRWCDNLKQSTIMKRRIEKADKN